MICYVVGCFCFGICIVEWCGVFFWIYGVVIGFKLICGCVGGCFFGVFYVWFFCIFFYIGGVGRNIGFCYKYWNFYWMVLININDLLVVGYIFLILISFDKIKGLFENIVKVFL